MARKDYYAILGVPRDAGVEQIRTAYKKLARKHHPDVNPGDKAAEERFKEIAEAYAVLGNAGKRAEYDRGPERFNLGFDPSEIFQRARAGGFEAFDLGSLFGDLFGGGGRGPRGFRVGPGADVTAEMEIGFDDGIRGATLPVTLSRGPGAPAETLSVRIPAGVREGSRVRLPGKGEPGPGGGPRGDLYVVIHLRPHPFFRREGDDLVLTAPLSLSEATLGTRIEVPTPHGTAKMTIPPGTRSGQRFRLRGKGAPRPGKPGTGDLYVDAQIVPPRKLDDESRDLLRRFAERNPQPELRRDWKL